MALHFASEAKFNADKGLRWTRTKSGREGDKVGLGLQIGYMTAAHVSSGHFKGLPCRTLQRPSIQVATMSKAALPTAGGRFDHARPSQPGHCADRYRVDLAGGSRAGAGRRPGAALHLPSAHKG